MKYPSIYRALLFPAYEALHGRRTNKYLAELERSQWLPSDQMRQLQLDRLNYLLAYARGNVPYYRRLWRDHGILPKDLVDLEDLRVIPILSKELIRDRYDAILAEPWRGRSLTKRTGGSTGQPLQFEYTQDSYARRTALMWRGYRWGGADLGRRSLYLWGVPLGSRRLAQLKESLFHAFANRRVINSFDMSEANLHEIAATIDRYKPEILVGYVAPLVILSEWLVTTGTHIHRPHAVLTGAESLSEAQREIIGNGLKARVFNTYGCREFGLMASECPDGRLHLSDEQLLVETVDDDGRLVVDRPGHVLVTDFSNLAMPFIRYRIGDVATISGKPCPCGRGLRCLGQVLGRELDLIKTPDGKIIPGELFPHLLKDYTYIRRYQVVQDRLDHIEVKIVVDSRDAAEKSKPTLIGQLKRQLGSRVFVDVVIVDDLPLTPAGKFRPTISLLHGLGDGQIHPA